MEERRKLIEDQKRQAALLEAELKINQVITDYILETESQHDASTSSSSLVSFEEPKEPTSSQPKEVEGEPKTLTEYVTRAETVGTSLESILAAMVLDVGELRNALRSLGSLSRGAFEMVGTGLTPQQVTLITENTQMMLRIGLELRNNPTVDSPDKRKELFSSAKVLIVLMKDLESAPKH